jgi:riboflavin biosynthesis pyrimidine reductase
VATRTALRQRKAACHLFVTGTAKSTLSQNLTAAVTSLRDLQSVAEMEAWGDRVLAILAEGGPQLLEDFVARGVVGKEQALVGLNVATDMLNAARESIK